MGAKKAKDVKHLHLDKSGKSKPQIKEVKFHRFKTMKVTLILVLKNLFCQSKLTEKQKISNFSKRPLI